MFRVLFLTCILAFLSCSEAFAQDDNSELEVHFVQKVLPVFKDKCFSCHGDKPDDLKGDLDLTSLKKMLSGGESGDPAIEINDADESQLVMAIEWDGLEMPPKENDRLNDKQISDVKQWINDGAIWPSQERIEAIKKTSWNQSDGEGQIVKTSGGQSDDWTYRRYKPEDVWAIQRVVKPKAPNGEYTVDAFVDQKLVDAKVTPAPRADSVTLIRRAAYDLTGLPPTPAEIEEFKSAFSKNATKAWSDLIDRLLSSPQYGERWGQHWLDVARYADTAGFSNDFELSNAWRYRDYVIRSFNNDLPYNRFVVQQLAGDELIAEQNEMDGKNKDGYKLDSREGQIATGFLRMGPWEHTSMTPERLSRQNYLDDLVNSVSQTFLSTALRCCKCHDHKFDPIPTRDYYRVYAAFRKTQPAEVETDFLAVESKSLFGSQKEHVQSLLDFAMTEQNLLLKKREAAAKAWYAEQGIEDKYVPYNVRAKRDFKGPKPRRFVGLTPQEEGTLKVREQDVRIWNRRLERFKPMVQSVYNGKDWLRNTIELRVPTDKERKNGFDNDKNFILDGGDIYSESEEVTPGVLSCVSISTPAATDEDPYALPNETDGRRLAFARWVTDPKNGLSTRSIVNRVWHYHFGKGIAANPNNFGGTGAKPTHSELLDWLTHDFVNHGWSIKRLHRRIMNSETYMRSTDHPDIEKLRNIDSNNRLLAVFEPRRLTAEEIRDSMLAATGELNLESGGLPIRPEMNLEVALSPRMIQFSIAPAYQPERTPEQRNRRSIYAYRVRGLNDPLMEVLDKPNPNESCELRDGASTTPQVFALLNGDVVIKRSIALASRLKGEHDSIEDQISQAFLLTTGQLPDRNVANELTEHYTEMVEYHQTHEPEAVKYPTKVTRSLVEELTGETFEYDEILNVYENYVADIGPADVDASTRALADICLLLFNSNQFVYVY